MSGAESAADPRVVVTVVRTGGVAGMRRRWQVEPPEPEASRWQELVDRCPWDAEQPTDAGGTPTDTGADRYVWRIRAHTPDRDRARDVPDGAMAGPWRELVDAVRAASA